MHFYGLIVLVCLMESDLCLKCDMPSQISGENPEDDLDLNWSVQLKMDFFLKII